MSFKWIVFTDLDGTLLDYHTYSFLPAMDGLELLKSRAIPLCIVSSKTRLEIEEVREEIGNKAPFIVENGGAVYIPRGYFPFKPEPCREIGDYLVVELGVRHELLTEELRKAKDKLAISARPISDLPRDEIKALTGIKSHQIDLMLSREYDEPFLIDGNIEGLKELLEPKGLSIIKGGRFYHLTGGNDKGMAVSILIDGYSRVYGEIRTIAIGDSENDIPMLGVVDIPVLVKRYDGKYEEGVLLAKERGYIPSLILADGIGPEGWNRAILEIIGGE